MFDTMEFIKAVPSRQGRPGVGERFEPYVRIVRNERWISVFHGAERIAKISFQADGSEASAMNQAAAIRDKLVADFHAAVVAHNESVTERKIAETRLAEETAAMQAAALANEYGTISAPAFVNVYVSIDPDDFIPGAVETAAEESQASTIVAARESPASISRAAEYNAKRRAARAAARAAKGD